MCSWNNFLFALVLANEKTRTLPVAVLGYIGYNSILWGTSMAAATFITLPVLCWLSQYGKRGLTLMASIVFGAGTSHTPMLNAAAEEWPLFEEIDRQRAHLHKDGRRATYDELLAVAPPSLQAELAPEKLSKRHAGAMAALGRLHDGLIGARLD